MRVLILALTLVLGLAAPAAAGGWAVTTLDALPGEIVAGETYQIGWTIRQHGQTPIDVESMGGTTEIVASAPGGKKTLSFLGRRDGPTGHYVTSVTFPIEGTWTWQVTQGPFEAQSLGTVVVAAAGAQAGKDAAAKAAKEAAAAAAAKDAAAVAAKDAAAQSGAANGAPAPAAPRSDGPNGWLVAALILASVGAALFFGSRVAALAPRPRSA
jgi:hypothetical protein